MSDDARTLVRCARESGGCITQRARRVLLVLHSSLRPHNDNADVGVQVQEQLERRALAAGATALGRVVNSQ